MTNYLTDSSSVDVTELRDTLEARFMVTMHRSIWIWDRIESEDVERPDLLMRAMNISERANAYRYAMVRLDAEARRLSAAETIADTTAARERLAAAAKHAQRLIDLELL